MLRKYSKEKQGQALVTDILRRLRERDLKGLGFVDKRVGTGM